MENIQLKPDDSNTSNIESQTYEVSGVKIGGKAGGLPTVLIGSIFYDGHKIVKDDKAGLFDEQKARELVEEAVNFSEKTGNPLMLDVVGNQAKAITRYIDFVINNFDGPFLIDSALRDVKISALNYVKQMGVEERVVYNSINEHITQDEIEAIRDSNITASIIMAYNSSDPTASGILNMLTSDKGLLKIASEAGIKKPLVDVPVLDTPSLGPVCDTIELVKKKVGAPTGCGPANAIYTWKGLSKKFGKMARSYVNASAAALMSQFADFILYGPIEESRYVFPSVAMTDAIMAYKGIFKGLKPRMRNHPLYKIFNV